MFFIVFIYFLLIIFIFYFYRISSFSENLSLLSSFHEMYFIYVIFLSFPFIIRDSCCIDLLCVSNMLQPNLSRLSKTFCRIVNCRTCSKMYVPRYVHICILAYLITMFAFLFGIAFLLLCIIYGRLRFTFIKYGIGNWKISFKKWDIDAHEILISSSCSFVGIDDFRPL